MLIKIYSNKIQNLTKYIPKHSILSREFNNKKSNIKLRKKVQNHQGQASKFALLMANKMKGMHLYHQLHKITKYKMIRTRNARNLMIRGQKGRKRIKKESKIRRDSLFRLREGPNELYTKWMWWLVVLDRHLFRIPE